MRSQLATSLAALAAASITFAAVHAEEEHRELGAHEHGHGILNIAIEGNKVAMELEAPGMDIVGFEHSAESKEQKAAVEKAEGQLARPLGLFKFPDAAGCSVKEAKVELETMREHEDEHEDGDHAESGHDAHDEHAGDKHDEEEHEGHNEFHVTYALSCSKPSNLTSIAFDYFKTFPGAQELTVNVITDKTQSKFEVNRDNPTLDLSATM